MTAGIPLPVLLFSRGYTDLIAVTPPTATLSPGSKLSPSQLGKVPGIRGPNGTWHGYDWRGVQATADDVMLWVSSGANIGLRAGRFPGIDIDTLDETMAEEIQEIALRVLGPAPIRTGRAPKRLLMYQAVKSFGRFRLHITDPGNTTHLIEVLAEGQQYLLYGTHPTTKKPYQWDREIPKAAELTGVSPASIRAFLDTVTELYRGRGFVVVSEGDGERREREVAGEQADLLAPSDEELARAVAMIPNTDELFPSRDSYIQLGYAIRASARDVERGFEIFSDWASRWTNPKGNNLDTVRGDWRRMRPPYSIGWHWLVEKARAHGYSDAQTAFEAEGLPPDAPADILPIQQFRDLAYTDKWLASEVVTRIGDRIRYASEMDRWLQWDGHRWQSDNVAAVIHEISEALGAIARELFADHSGTDKEKWAAQKSERIVSTYSRNAVIAQVKVDPRIAVGTGSLDADPWRLNTPAGVVDLKSGNISQASPDMLITRMTAVGPDGRKDAPLWKKFLQTVTQNDVEMQSYLQRFAGYALTGSIREQVALFLWGSGTNGKSVFVNALKEALGDDYVATAPMDLFSESRFDKHPTDVASLRGKRLVTASETEDGRRWDEQKLKQMTGGEAITARFMRQDSFSFTPQFKLIFLGNHQPKVRDIGPAIRRRLHIAGFTYQIPADQIDLDLGEKLKAEAPQILAWMIEGALRWQTAGKLDPPASVKMATEEYFESQDAIGAWMAEACEIDPSAVTETTTLFDSWREWANRAGERYPNAVNGLSAALKSRGYGRMKDPKSRRSVTVGLRVRTLNERTDLL